MNLFKKIIYRELERLYNISTKYKVLLHIVAT